MSVFTGIMSAVGHVTDLITAPYRAIDSFVDARPSGSQIKRHIAAIRLDIQENLAGETTSIVLSDNRQVPGGDKMVTTILDLRYGGNTGMTKADMKMYANGFLAGAEFVQTTVVGLRRGHIKIANANLVKHTQRNVALAKAAAQEASANVQELGGAVFAVK